MVNFSARFQSRYVPDRVLGWSLFPSQPVWCYILYFWLKNCWYHTNALAIAWHQVSLFLALPSQWVGSGAREAGKEQSQDSRPKLTKGHPIHCDVILSRKLRTKRRTGGRSSSLCVFSQAARRMLRPCFTGNSCWWEAVNELLPPPPRLRVQLLLSLLNCNYLHLRLLTFSPSQVKRGLSKLQGTW